MKRFVLRHLTNIIRIIATLTVRRYKPFVIGVTGTVGKTSAKEAIRAVVTHERGAGEVRASAGNFNNEIGLPLTVIGEWERTGGIVFWLHAIGKGVWQLLMRRPYPRVLILEYAADRPGDLARLLEVAAPQIGVVTAIGEIPAHVEFYSSPEAVAREKARLIEALPREGFAILNADDALTIAMRDRTRARTLLVGFDADAEIRLTNFEHRFEGGHPVGISFKCMYGGSTVPVRLLRCFGKPQAYAAGMAAAVGIAMGMNLLAIAQALERYESPGHRMKLIPGLKESILFDDTYNASPLSMKAALETIGGMPAARTVAILGDMLEIGPYAIPAHEEVGRLAARDVGLLVTIGPRAKFIADAAMRQGLSRRNVVSFDTVDEAVPSIANLIKKGDLVLMKASRAMRLDRVVEELRAQSSAPIV